jgi:hypothetical protein
MEAYRGSSALSVKNMVRPGRFFADKCVAESVTPRDICSKSGDRLDNLQFSYVTGASCSLDRFPESKYALTQHLGSKAAPANKAGEDALTSQLLQMITWFAEAMPKKADRSDHELPTNEVVQLDTFRQDIPSRTPWIHRASMVPIESFNAFFFDQRYL